MLGMLGFLSFISLSIGVFFWLQGATLVLPFAFLEIAVLGAAFVVFARHAADVERIMLTQGCLVVELESGGTSERAEFDRNWVKIDPESDGSLIRISGQGRLILVGRHIRADQRPLLAQEIRRALRGV